MKFNIAKSMAEQFGASKCTIMMNKREDCVAWIMFYFKEECNIQKKLEILEWVGKFCVIQVEGRRICNNKTLAIWNEKYFQNCIVQNHQVVFQEKGA